MFWKFSYVSPGFLGEPPVDFPTCPYVFSSDVLTMFPNSFLIYHWVRVEATNAQGSSTASLVLGLPMLMLAESAAISYLGNIVIFCNPLKGGVPIKRRCLLTFQGPCIGPSPRYIYIYIYITICTCIYRRLGGWERSGPNRERVLSDPYTCVLLLGGGVCLWLMCLIVCAQNGWGGTCLVFDALPELISWCIGRSGAPAGAGRGQSCREQREFLQMTRQ